VEKIVFAEEIKKASPQLYHEAMELIKQMEREEKIVITIEYVPHEQFKSKTAAGRAVIRTGEFSPYANIILSSGVVF